jgi:hypothetical protein
MKIANPSLALILALVVPGCTNDADPPNTTTEAASTGEAASTTEAAEASTGADPGDASTSEGTAGPSSEAESSSGPGMPQHEVLYFRGVSDNFLPDGTPTGTDQILARRETDPEAAQILETLYLVAPDATWQRFELVQDVDVAAGTFTAEFATDFGNLVIEGEYTSGEDWAWDGWRSRSTYIDGLSEGWVVTSEDHVLPDGSHEADKEVLDPEGTLMFVIEEQAEPIDQAEYEAAVAELE